MPLQLDMAFVAIADRLSSAIADEAVRTAELLFRLTPMSNGPPNITGYRQAFVMRYGTNERSLTRALGPRMGPGADRTIRMGGA